MRLRSRNRGINHKFTPASHELAQLLTVPHVQAAENRLRGPGVTQVAGQWMRASSGPTESPGGRGSFQWLFPDRAVPWRSYLNCAFNAGSPLGTCLPAVAELG